MRFPRTTSALALPAVLTVALLAAGCAPTGTSAGASCAAPAVDVEDGALTAGGAVRLAGTAFVEGCADFQGVSDGEPLPAESTAPMSDLAVRWVQGTHDVELATVDADAHGEWSAVVMVPDDAAPGDAVIRVAPAADVAVTVAR
ncbi:hypothetical protein [Isoptericola sp. NPDC057559]|uniref:hypothetical protein n=1 Tax=Isoptericola sp. NPDC057559 TaxID=3346168 RepID=UPI0036822105